MSDSCRVSTFPDPADGIRGAPPPPPPPLPPQLVSARPAQSAVFKPPHYRENLASTPESHLLLHPKQCTNTKYKPTYYFFYGTLTNPDILQGVLGLNTEPSLRTARIHGYEIAEWGQYKALIGSKPGTVVTGHAYLVRSVEEAYKLAYYETNAYALEPCNIHFTDGGADGEEEDDDPTGGKTFLYAGDARALKEGRFDCALWEIQMGKRLPRKWCDKGDKAPQGLDEVGDVDGKG